MIPHSRPSITKKEKDIIAKVLKTKNLSQSTYTELFEKRLCEYIGSNHSIAVSSGTSAIFLLLKALELKKGDKVIIPNYVCSSVYYAVLWAGCRPVSCEVDRNGIIDEEKLNELIDDKTAAIIGVNLFGKLFTLRNNYKIPIIDDAAQSIGGYDKSGKSGIRTGMGICSFYATKVITSLGNGGAVFINDSSLYQKIINMRKNDISKTDKFEHFQLRLSDVNAGFGIIQLKRINELLKRRRNIYNYYVAELKRYEIELPIFKANETIFRFIIKLKKPDKFTDFMLKQGVECKRPVALPVHKIMNITENKFPVSNELLKSSVSIPLYPDLRSSEIEFIIKSIKKYFNK
ncbi:MAG: DegT/DnrJ/EryC1/StrS aminotransferase family protein [Candidatus Hydrogenedentota bacterium]